MKIIPITFKTACDFIKQHHRHHAPTVGCKFCVACENVGELVGVAVCGRPVSRRFDNGKICEINRLCTDGTYNACSMLYGACARIAKNMGVRKNNYIYSRKRKRGVPESKQFYLRGNCRRHALDGLKR